LKPKTTKWIINEIIIEKVKFWCHYIIRANLFSRKNEGLAFPCAGKDPL